MSFQYKESDKRGNPIIKFVEGDWVKIEDFTELLDAYNNLKNKEILND